MILREALLTALLVFALAVTAQAYTCDRLAMYLDGATTHLRRASSESDFENARQDARCARNELQPASFAAADCGCPSAQKNFDSAAAQARRARDASSPDDFADYLSRAIDFYNSGIDALKSCGAS